MGFKDVLKAVSPLAMVADKNPDVLRAFGVAGNAAANKLENREDDKRMEAERQAQAAAAQARQQKAAEARANYVSAVRAPTGGMEGYKGYKKGGKVSSASKRADGCAIRGKTKGTMR
jgi:hypothetical protein